MRLKRIVTRLFLFIGSIFFGGILYFLLSVFIENKIESRLVELGATTSSISVNLITRSLNIAQLEWKTEADSLNPYSNSVSIKEISLKGIHLFSLLFSNRVIINHVALNNGTVWYNIHTKDSNGFSSDKIKSVWLKSMSLRQMETHILKDSTTSFSGFSNSKFTNLKVALDSGSAIHYTLDRAEADLEDIQINSFFGMYSGKIARVRISTVDQSFEMDSAELIPNFDKFEFGHKAAKQVSRIDLLLPHLSINGINFNLLADSSYIASVIRIDSFNLHVFRDKRIPFLQADPLSLPMASFLKIPYWIKIDSILISNSVIVIEEFPENAIASGVITFNEVSAVLVGLNNQSEKSAPKYAQLNTTGRLMNSGKIDALFQFPLDGVSVYTAKGSIIDMDFRELNPVLAPMANVRIESGYLNKLIFDFNYDEFVSKGTSDIDYKELRIISLNTNKRSTNEIRTFLINAIVKRDKARSVSSIKGRGVIDFERDRKRYVFNLWWKSILDGIKSSIL
jgi:hypothetical protein